MSTPEQHNLGQREAVTASLLRAATTAEAHGCYPKRPKPAPEPTAPDEAAA